MVERLAAGRGGRDRDAELVLDRLLPDEVLERARPQRRVELLVGLGFSSHEAEELLDGAAGETPEDLIAHALKESRR